MLNAKLILLTAVTSVSLNSVADCSDPLINHDDPCKTRSALVMGTVSEIRQVQNVKGQYCEVRLELNWIRPFRKCPLPDHIAAQNYFKVPQCKLVFRDRVYGVLELTEDTFKFDVKKIY